VAGGAHEYAADVYIAEGIDVGYEFL